MTDWTTAALMGAAVLVVVVLVALLVRLRRETARALARAAEEQAALVARLEQLERARAAVAGPVAEFVITDVGNDDGASAARSAGPVAARIEGRLFADLVLRETVVKAAAWGHGVRRAFAPEVRNRARFEMRRETKRAARQRKVDVKEALRQYQARARGDVA